MYRWEWRLEASPEALWPFVADTNRFNRDAGVPSVARGGAAGANARRRLSLSSRGLRIEWDEEPFEWVEPHRFSVVRRYARGPLAEMRVSTELQRLGEGGTLLVYDVDPRPRNALGRLAVPVEIGVLSRRRFERTFREYDRLALAAAPAMRSSNLAPGGSRRLAAARDALLARALDPALVGRLCDLVEHGDELTVERLRPYSLADLWEAPRRPVLELFLHATRAGLLEFRWDLLCPLCRGAAESSRSLDGIAAGVHCNSCHIDFGADFGRSVELSFRPSPSVRPIEAREFCVGGPRLTPHVVAQQLVAPGASRVIDTALEPGHYRLRALDGRAFASLFVGQGPAEATVRLGDPAGDLLLGEAPRLRLENGTGAEELVVLERTAWRDDVVTAAEVTALQLFRDLFSSEALRPGEPISVGTLTVVFTDLRDSTRFYREWGDAPAFGSVMEHLDVLGTAVARNGGAVVKAMGDAIMAVFTRPIAALDAAFEAQREVAAGTPALHLKVGVHTGPAIAVTQNGRLDYFGSTVNLAARLVGLSTGMDVVASGAVLADPEVADRLDGALAAEPAEATLKGFEADPVELWRLTERAEVASVAN